MFFIKMLDPSLPRQHLRNHIIGYCASWFKSFNKYVNIISVTLWNSEWWKILVKDYKTKPGRDFLQWPCQRKGHLVWSSSSTSSTSVVNLKEGGCPVSKFFQWGNGEPLGRLIKGANFFHGKRKTNTNTKKHLLVYNSNDKVYTMEITIGLSTFHGSGLPGSLGSQIHHFLLGSRNDLGSHCFKIPVWRQWEPN